MLTTYLRPLHDRAVLFLSGGIALIYLISQELLFNKDVLYQTALSNFPLSYKLHLSLDLLSGYFAMYPPLQLSFILVTAGLVGLNLTLAISLMQRMRKNGSMKMSLGGSSVLAVVSTGCPSCGLSVLSLLGPSSGFAAVLLHSTTAQFMIGLLLLASICYSLFQLQKSVVCKLPRATHGGK